MDKGKKKILNNVMNVVYPLIAFGLVLGIWALVAYVKNKPLIFPMPDEAITKFFGLFAADGFWKSVGWTLLRTVICFTLSLVLAFALASLGGLWKPVHRVLSPIIGILRAAPTMAIILIAMLWLDGQRAPILIGFLIAFPLLYQSVYTAITGVDAELVEMTKLYKVSPLNKVVNLYMPEIAPAVFDASRSTASLTLKVVIAAEVLAYAKNSIGLSMQSASQTFDVGLLLAWTMIAIMFSFVFEGVIAGLKKLWEVSR